MQQNPVLVRITLTNHYYYHASHACKSTCMKRPSSKYVILYVAVIRPFLPTPLLIRTNNATQTNIKHLLGKSGVVCIFHKQNHKQNASALRSRADCADSQSLERREIGADTPIHLIQYVDVNACVGLYTAQPGTKVF